MATNTQTNNNWLEIDIKGFAQILRNKGIARIALEPISNAFDTEATEISVSFTQEKGTATLIVTDDDPDGFADLRDAYMLFAPSKRREDPTKRGRFGQGEKELIAVCFDRGYVSVESTTGTIMFDQDGRSKWRRKTEAGTKLTAGFKCNREQAEEFEALVRLLIVPEGVKLTFNGDVVDRPTPVKVVRETLPTKIVDDEGNLADTRRLTDIELYEPISGEKAQIYELGVPVVEHDGRWNVNVMQKVPLNADRSNVTPSYLRRLREIMLNETHDLLTSVDMKSAWVRDALPNATDEAVTSYTHEKYGKNAVIYDPSDPEANKRAMDQGRTIIYGRQEHTDTFRRFRESNIVMPAGQVLPTGVPTSPDGEPPIPRAEWNESMLNMERYVHELGEHLLGFAPDVAFHNINVRGGGGHTQAWWGAGSITFNLRWLGKSWAAEADQEKVDALVIHEFAHHNTGTDHFNDRFIHKLAELGAKLRSCKAVLR